MDSYRGANIVSCPGRHIRESGPDATATTATIGEPRAVRTEDLRVEWIFAFEVLNAIHGQIVDSKRLPVILHTFDSVIRL